MEVLPERPFRVHRKAARSRWRAKALSLVGGALGVLAAVVAVSCEGDIRADRATWENGMPVAVVRGRLNASSEHWGLVRQFDYDLVVATPGGGTREVEVAFDALVRTVPAVDPTAPQARIDRDGERFVLSTQIAFEDGRRALALLLGLAAAAMAVVSITSAVVAVRHVSLVDSCARASEEVWVELLQERIKTDHGLETEMRTYRFRIDGVEHEQEIKGYALPAPRRMHLVALRELAPPRRVLLLTDELLPFDFTDAEWQAIEERARAERAKLEARETTRDRSSGAKPRMPRCSSRSPTEPLCGAPSR